MKINSFHTAADILAKRVNCINSVYRFINNATGELRAALADGFNTKADGTLYKKDSEKMRTIIDRHNTDNLNVYVDCKGYGVSLRVKASPYGPIYFEDYTYLWGDSDAPLGDYSRKLLTAEKVRAAEMKVLDLDNELQYLIEKRRALIWENKLQNQRSFSA